MIPLTVLGGFLGSGKTTLINRWLQQQQVQGLAILVNDFGSINIDQELIVSHHGQTIALANGCVCCSIGNDLSQTLAEVCDLAPKHIVIEASGVALPGKIADLALVDPILERNGVIVTVDASQLPTLLKDPQLNDTLLGQIKQAQFLVFSKLDLCSPELLQQSQALIQQLAPGIEIFDAQQTALLQLMGASDDISPANARHNHFNQWLESDNQCYEVAELRQQLNQLPRDILRVKGWVREPRGGWKLIQKVGKRLDISPLMSQQTPKQNSLIFIAKSSFASTPSPFILQELHQP